MRRQQGFTLIELMIVVAIIAILSAIAIPAYSDYVMRSRITEAVSTLSAQRVKMEQFFQDNRTYVGACMPNTVAPRPTGTYFVFSCPTLTASTYSLLATGQPPMTGFTYTVDQANLRTSTGPAGWTGSNICWILKKDGSC